MTKFLTAKLFLTNLLTASLLMLTSFAVPNVWAAKALVERKEIPSIYEENIGGKNFTVSKVIVHAPAEQVWRTLTDYSRSCAVFPQLRKCEVVKDKGTTKVMRHQIQPSGLPGAYQYVIEVKETAPKTLEWHRISGDFKSVDGFWKLEAANGGHDTLVTYSSYVNGGMLIPQFLIKRQCKLDMPKVMANLKHETEGSHIRIARRTELSTTE